MGIIPNSSLLSPNRHASVQKSHPELPLFPFSFHLLPSLPPYVTQSLPCFPNLFANVELSNQWTPTPPPPDHRSSFFALGNEELADAVTTIGHGDGWTCVNDSNVQRQRATSGRPGIAAEREGWAKRGTVHRSDGCTCGRWRASIS